MSTEDDQLFEIKPIQWDDVQDKLKGRKTFVSPIVTQEVLLESLRSTAMQLLTVTAEHAVTKKHVTKLLSDNDMLKDAVDTLNTQVNALSTSLKNLNKRVTAGEEWQTTAGDPAVLGTLGGRMEEIEAHKEYIVQLGDLFNRFGTVETWQTSFVDEWIAHTEDYKETKEWKEETDVIVKELKKAADESISQEELKEMLDALQSKVKKAETNVEEAQLKLTKHDEDIATKVTLEAFEETKQVVDQHDKTFSQVTALAQGMTDKLEHASSEVERMAIRVDDNAKKVDEIFSGIETGSLGGGMKEEEVDEKIELKYSMIVDQLESAISSATEDEDEFRRIANDLQDMVRKMQMGKADKREMAEVREKLMVDGRLREQVDTLRVLSDMKVSHEEAEQMLQSKASRRELRQSLDRLTGDISNVVDTKLNDFEEATAGPSLATASSMNPSDSRGSFSLCLTCNRRVDKEDQLSKSNKRHGRGGGSNKGSSHGIGSGLQIQSMNKPNITQMGPGGAALGGGFQVRSGGGGNNKGHGSPHGGHGGHGGSSNAKRQQQFHNLPPEYSLPQIDPRLAKPATFVMGNDGRVYPGQRKQQLHTFNMNQRSQSTGDINGPNSRTSPMQQKGARTPTTPSRINLGGPETPTSGGSPFVTQVRDLVF